MTPLQFRVFRLHFLCDACPNEWSEEAAVVTRGYCPCCDAAAEPYDVESLLEPVEALAEAEN